MSSIPQISIFLPLPQFNFIKKSLVELVKENEIKEIKLWIQAKKDLNIKDDEGMTALHHAAKNESEEILKLLIDAKCDANIFDKKGRLPLHYACEVGKLENVKLLLPITKDINLQDIEKNTPLHLAIGKANEHPKIIEFLMEQDKINPDIFNKDGYTPLQSAVEDDKTMNEIFKILFESKKCNLELLSKNKTKDSLVHLIVRANNRVILSYLQKYYVEKIDWNEKNEERETPMKITINKNMDTELAKILVKALSSKLINCAKIYSWKEEN